MTDRERPETAPRKPGWVPIWLACKCGTKWDDWQPNNVPVKTWLAHVKTFRCPVCGNKGRGLFLRSDPKATP